MYIICYSFTPPTLSFEAYVVYVFILIYYLFEYSYNCMY